ncbi:hypothetical protein OUZ56_011734 [Daphnia magna]|uniref:Uncharacterized protein n=1 Tax=Daphnia magna TaxID=35525 RepID=A0ABQ9Z181_9CRUS|nr:hypothetical protein OUZ56_011734 [Daphnia magna]
MCRILYLYATVSLHGLPVEVDQRPIPFISQINGGTLKGFPQIPLERERQGHDLLCVYGKTNKIH